MSDLPILDARRRCLKTLAVASLAAVGLGFSRWSQAQALPEVTAADPTAKALGYVAKAADSKNPARKPGADCAACRFYDGGKGKMGPCQMFPGKDVQAGGWCQAFAAKS